MASTSELSLDDIIRKKRPTVSQRGRGGIRKGGVVRPQFKQNSNPGNKNVPNFQSKRGGFVSRNSKLPIVGDARNKIILKNRTKIADARDKLAEMAKHKDARIKLQQLRMSRGNINRNIGPNGNHQNNRNGMNFKNRGRPNRGGFTDLTRQVHSSPLMFPPMPSRNIQLSPMMSLSGYSMDISMDEEEYIPAPLKPIIRSVNNDIHHYLPPPPDFPIINRLRNPKPLRDKTVLNNRQSNFNLTIVAKNNDLRKTSSSSAGILKRIHRPEERIYTREHSPTSPVSILKKRPSASLRSRLEAPHSDSSDTMIARRPIAAQRPTTPTKPTGYRIVVSNLQNTVSAADIHELFGDIGELLESRLVRPGTAEVIYSSLKVAQKAVDVYHNRQLDGHPMNCFLVNPRTPPPVSRHGTAASKTNTRATTSTLPASSNSSVIPDISTFYKVLFGKDQN